MAVKIRSLTLQDAASYRRCWDIIAKEDQYIVEDKAPPLSEIRAQIRGILRMKTPFLVAVDGKRVVGFVAIYGSSLPSMGHCVDLGMGLHPDYREMGLGTKLLGRVLKMCRGKYDSVVLFVFRKNKRAQNLYKKLGFEPRGGINRGVKLPSGFDDSLIMQKQLRR